MTDRAGYETAAVMPIAVVEKLHDLEEMERTLLAALFTLGNNRANAIARQSMETAFMWARRGVVEEWRERELEL